MRTPRGWKLVPVTLDCKTLGALKDGFVVNTRTWVGNPEDLWAKLLAAVPRPPKPKTKRRKTT